mmetsp:Transcript_21388/g.49776  ORF Transcript_21388/g.49776 Transcript_21388/m.49776 type:complete len:227 (-) Transcript_21388:736-1416(-)
MHEGEAPAGNTAATAANAATSDIFGRQAPLEGRRIRHVHAPTGVHERVCLVPVPDQRLVAGLQGEPMPGIHTGCFCPGDTESSTVEELDPFDECTVGTVRLPLQVGLRVVQVCGLVVPSHHRHLEAVVWAGVKGQGVGVGIFRPSLLHAGAAERDALGVDGFPVDLFLPRTRHVHVALLLLGALLVAIHPLFGPFLKRQATRAHRLLLFADDVVEEAGQTVGATDG